MNRDRQATPFLYVYDEYEHHQKTPQVAYESDTLAIPMDMSQGSDVEE